jgi:hypothetical protein
VKRILGIFLLAGLLSAGPGCWLQLHRLSCCAASPFANSDAAGPEQAFHYASHNSTTCPVCSALHAPVAFHAVIAPFNPHLPIAMIERAPMAFIANPRPIPTDCRGPPVCDCASAIV